MYQARRTAVDRMTAECAALGGHGVVGVRLSRGALPLSGLDFTAAGTAVRAPGAADGQRALFTCDVSGQDFAKLIAAGWVPAGLAVGISIGSRHDDRRLAGQARWWSGNVEVAGWTELVNQSRHDARRRLEHDVRRLGGEGVVITGMQMRVRERDCPATAGRRDHIAEVTLTGTAIARFSRAGRCPAGPALTVMPLGPLRPMSRRIVDPFLPNEQRLHSSGRCRRSAARALLSSAGHDRLILVVQAIARQMVAVAGQTVQAASALCRRRTLAVRAKMKVTVPSTWGRQRRGCVAFRSSSSSSRSSAIRSSIASPKRARNSSPDQMPGI
jgi:uncharacterized protein YbjQ (UPF0145 family)